MRDDYSLKLFQKAHINILMSKPETASAAIYWMLNFALSQIFVKMGPTEFQSLMILCMFTMQRLYDYNKNFVAHDGLSMRRGAGVNVLCAFSKTFMQNYILHIA